MSTSHVIGALAAAAVLLAVVALVLALQVEDWRRDLVTNVAETDSAHPDSLLHPLTVSLAVPEVVALVERSVASLPRWQYAGLGGDSATVQLRFVRTSRLFRFRDDITVWVEQQDGASAIRARSASRVGTGDLGQNPRNLRQLMGVIRDRIDSTQGIGTDSSDAGAGVRERR